MEESQLKVLEERINNAITFIGKLKDREKRLVSEKEQVEGRVRELETLLEEKDLKIEALRENQVFLKNKIETILDKLEGLANIEQAAGEDDEEESGEQSPAADSSTAAPQPPLGTPREVNERNPVGESGFSLGPASSANEEAASAGDSAEESGIVVEENLVDLKQGEADKDQEQNQGPVSPNDTREQTGRNGNLFDNPFIEL